ncbi:DNA (cytosine-5-)-methyltransferase [Sphingopyxis panaciterrae]|uniref:DNA (cytosine-5-)-methyltransferase n=1 Tax=Sphingopyxis panaciterrae TaxID=363841 RepID=UPI00141FC4CE
MRQGDKTGEESPVEFTCGALFSGIGGFCLGFEQAQFATRWAVEFDEHAARTYGANLDHVRLLEKSVEAVTVAGDALEPVDVLHAGFPCQSFSQAGEKRGFDDPRGQLFFEIIRLIGEFGKNRPKVLVLENAPFLRYGEGGAWFLQLERAIRKAGYWFGPANCAELTTNELTELPQQRTRLYMVALCMSTFRSGRFDFPSEQNATPKDMRRWVDFDGSVDKEYYLPAENRYFDMISKTVTDRECLYQLRKYEVRAKERGVCPTLTANMGLGGHNVPFIMNCQGLRKLTEYECLNLQGFPEGFQFPQDVPRAKRYVQVGNAVSVPMAKLIADRVRSRLLEEVK